MTSHKSRSRYERFVEDILADVTAVDLANDPIFVIEHIRKAVAELRLLRSETASRNAAPQEGAGSPAGPAANGELAVAAFINDLPIPEEFHALASFYDVKDLSSLVRMQQEHIEGLQAKLPPTPTFPGPQRVREG
jgi:hypothetical protein